MRPKLPQTCAARPIARPTAWQREERRLALELHDRAMEIVNAANAIKKQAAEDVYTNLSIIGNRSRPTLAVYSPWVSHPPPNWIPSVGGANLSKLRALHQEILSDFFLWVLMTIDYIPFDPRRVTHERTVIARTSRAWNIAKHLLIGDRHAISLVGTSANHPELNAEQNMAVLAVCAELFAISMENIQA